MRILVGLSGGVDSSVCIKKLVEAGFDVAGLYLDMKSGNDDFPVLCENSDFENSDLKSAFQCASTYGIKLYKFGCEKLFDRIVKENFALEYAKGRTPNPCVICNRLVKFACLLKCADILGYEKIATGHYAKTGKSDNGRYYVSMGNDMRKEQSYMLWNLTQEQLARIEFPLGDTLKTDNVFTAKSDGLSAAERGESLDICFIDSDDNYADFIERRMGKFPDGNFISPDGKICGRHKGIIRYTVGQRKGLGIALGEPVFVKKIDCKSGNIYLAKSGDEYTNSLSVSEINFMETEPTEHFSGDLLVKIRYAAKPVPAKVTICGKKCTVDFYEPVRAVTPGQSAVFYNNDRIAFGGFID